MLDLLLDTVYRQETAKTASAALTEKLRTMPMDVVEKIAFGSAPKCVGDSGDVKCWLDNFKGTPLFDKAVELERADLQLEQAELEQRMNNQANDTWTKRDALRLQKRMLELDLAMAGTGAGAAAPAGPEAEEEQGIALLEQAQAEEAAAGEGNKPEEQMENNAIAELHAAHGEGAPPAEEKTPPKLPAAAEEGPPGPPGAQAKAPPKPPAKKEPPKEEPKPAEDEKQAAMKVAAAEAAGRLLAKVAEPAPPKGMSVKEWDKVLQKKTAAAEPEGHHIRRALIGNPLSSAIEAKPGSRLDAFGEANGHVQAEGLKGVLKGGLGGAALGALAGGFAGARSAPPGSMLRNGIGTALAGGLVGGSLGAPLGGAVGSVKGHLDEEASRIHGARSQHKTAGINVGGLVGAAKSAVPQVAGALSAGKSMVGTAMKAGGLPQVAKSVGNVATGFAKANPLAAAGVAGAAGLAAGRLSKSNAPRTQG